MTPQTSSRIMVLLSMAYGLTIGVLAIVGAAGVGAFAAIGGMVLGLLWVARALFTKHPN